MKLNPFLQQEKIQNRTVRKLRFYQVIGITTSTFETA